MPIRTPKAVRYIKLGWGGEWESECLKKRIIRFSFGTGTAERFSMCQLKQWEDLKKSFLNEGKNQGTATRFTNEARIFFEDDGSTLWITFMGGSLHWGFLDPAPAQQHTEYDGNGRSRSVCRSVIGGWRCTDVNGEPLTNDRLAGSVTKLAAYRGTSCTVDVADYVVRRINGEKMPKVERGVAALAEMKNAAMGMLTLMEPRDFETLVDLVFSTSGWRRQGSVGKTQKTLDIDILLPSTGERAFVQVKSKTDDAQLVDYIQRLDELGPYDRMFYVYHSGKTETDDDRVTVIGPEKLAALVVEAGLVNWLIQKVS
jgi:hypothetical protein